MVSLKTIKKTHVKPKKKLGRTECQLVTFDLPYLAFFYNQKLMFYKCGDFEGVVAKLKDGLELVLEEFYQLAGKLGKDEEGVFKVEYDDDLDGVEVVEAVADTFAVEDLAAEEGTSIFKDLLPYNGILNWEGLHRPLLAIQVRSQSCLSTILLGPSLYEVHSLHHNSLSFKFYANPLKHLCGSTLCTDSSVTGTILHLRP